MEVITNTTIKLNLKEKVEEKIVKPKPAKSKIFRAFEKKQTKTKKNEPKISTEKKKKTKNSKENSKENSHENSTEENELQNEKIALKKASRKNVLKKTTQGMPVSFDFMNEFDPFIQEMPQYEPSKKCFFLLRKEKKL